MLVSETTSIGRQTAALTTMGTTAEESNRYRFMHRVSDVDPIDLTAVALNPSGDVLEVEVGSASAKPFWIR